jgi:hypothetical protein
MNRTGRMNGDAVDQAKDAQTVKKWIRARGHVSGKISHFSKKIVVNSDLPNTNWL